jgi:hypothetical protein
MDLLAPITLAPDNAVMLGLGFIGGTTSMTFRGHKGAAGVNAEVPILTKSKTGWETGTPLPDLIAGSNTDNHVMVALLP